MEINDLTEQLAKLEILYTEQENTIQALDDVVTRQAREIGQLNSVLDQLKQQFQDIKTSLPEQFDEAEKPPHY